METYTPKKLFEFQSTPSVGRATIIDERCTKTIEISIHALRGEGDQKKMVNLNLLSLFQSTPSVGRATIPFNLM